MLFFDGMPSKKSGKGIFSIFRGKPHPTPGPAPQRGGEKRKWGFLAAFRCQKSPNLLFLPLPASACATSLSGEQRVACASPR